MCLESRAIYIEMIKNMDTDSFTLELRRFIGRRGNIRTIRCDNGSNFVGAQRQLAKCWKEVNQKKVGEFMLQNSADWIQWKTNPPLASHMGGVWERHIRFATNILSSLLKTHGVSLMRNRSIHCLLK